MTQPTIQDTFALALQHHQARRLKEAEQLYRQILAQQPNHADSLHMLGVLAAQAGQPGAAVELIRQALAVQPDNAQALYNLGNALKAAGQLDAAIIAWRQAVAFQYNHAEAYNNLGAALKERGRLDEAIAACRQAIAFRANSPEAYSNLCVLLKQSGRLDEAIAAARQAIALHPNYAGAYYNLGTALSDKGQLDPAIAAYRQAIARKNNLPDAHSNLGVALKKKAQLDEAIAAWRQAIALKPHSPEAYDNLVYTLHFHPAYDAQAIYQEHERWNQQFAEPLKKYIRPHNHDRNPNRRLRIGYVAPYFCDHCQSFFTIPVLSQHDHQNYHIACYANVPRPDALTARFQGYADTWRNTTGLSDEQVAEQIRQDQIDILVDLTLHMDGNRLLVFARKPAPVQVTWLGYPASTGLTAIDYRLSDPYLDPPDRVQSVYSEQTLCLPDSFWCYDPLHGRDISVNPLPALDAGMITFGCLNNFCKINDGVLDLWAQVLVRIENSRLLLLAHEGDHRQRTVDRLQQHGVSPARVEFLPRQSHIGYLELYHRLDIGLDTFPYNGHTTSLDSFWMGVPVVTLVGQTAVARAGWCQLSNLGLADLAGHTPEQFVRIAVALANDLPKLRQLRSTLRQKMAASPLMDAPRFTRNLEAVYRQMWQKWCVTAGGK